MGWAIYDLSRGIISLLSMCSILSHFRLELVPKLNLWLHRQLPGKWQQNDRQQQLNTAESIRMHVYVIELPITVVTL